MPSDSLALALALAPALFLLSACAVERTTLDDSAVDVHAGVDAELDFWDDLADRRVVTNHDALYGLLLVASDEPPAPDYDGLVTAARERGWITDDAERPPDESATVGDVAVAVCDILAVEGGVTLNVFGPSPRYCTRELVFLEIIPWRTDRQSLTGLEFVDLVTRVEEMLE